MSNFNESSDFAAFCRMYKKWESENPRPEGMQSQQPVGPQHAALQRPPLQRSVPIQHQPQAYRQSPLQNPEHYALVRYHAELKKRVDDIYTMVNSVQNALEEIKTFTQATKTYAQLQLEHTPIDDSTRVVEGNMERMHRNLERFEVFGKGVLQQVSSNLQTSSGSPSQPQNSFNPPAFAQASSQPQTAPPQPQNPYGQGSTTAQPPPSFPPQPSDSYTEPYNLDYNLFSDILANDT